MTQYILPAFDNLNPGCINAFVTAKLIPAKVPAPITSLSSETSKGGKNVEVFSQGQKIVGANASNIGDLPEGIYLIKVTNGSAKK